jgi:hypothetical protein
MQSQSNYVSWIKKSMSITMFKLKNTVVKKQQQFFYLSENESANIDFPSFNLVGGRVWRCY